MTYPTRHMQHVYWASLDTKASPPMLTVCERYEGIQTLWRRGYRVSLLDWERNEEVTTPVVTTSPEIAAWAIWSFTDGGEGDGFYPNLLELEEA